MTFGGSEAGGSETDRSDPVGTRAIGLMRREIATIPDVIADQATSLRPRLRDIARSLPNELMDIVLTGCGDSHFAGVATRLAFERAAGVRCRPTEALELARYEVRYVPVVPEPPLLVAVSYSGEVGRTIEAAVTARAFGWRTIALTGKADSRLAQAVGDPVLMDVPTLGSTPGTSTYVAMVTALLVLAAELARARGRIVEADRLDREIASAPELATATLGLSDQPAQQLAEIMTTETVVTFIGAGPSRASASFGAAKLLEGAQRHGVAQDLEEWAHEQYFVSGPGTPIVVIAPTGASRNRAAELVAEMSFIGATTAFVSDDVDDVAARSASIVLPIKTNDEAVSPLISCLPLALAAFYLSEARQTRSYGFRSGEHEREHYETIHRDARAEPA